MCAAIHFTQLNNGLVARNDFITAQALLSEESLLKCVQELAVSMQLDTSFLTLAWLLHGCRSYRHDAGSFMLNAVLVALNLLGVAIHESAGDLQWCDVERWCFQIVCDGHHTALPPLPARTRRTQTESSEVPSTQVDDLQAEIVTLCDANAALRSQLRSDKKKLHKRIKFWHLACITARNDAQRAQEELINSRALKQDVQRQHLSVKAGMGIALQRCASNTSARRLGIALQGDVAHQTVCKWELMLDAAMKAASKHLYMEWMDDAFGKSDHEEPRSSSTPISIHVIKADATNKSVWQKQKLHLLKLKTLFSADVAAGHRGFEETVSWGDMLPQTDSTALGTLALLSKQLKSVGMPDWQDLAQRFRAWGAMDVESRAYKDVIITFIMNTDAGSDQVKARHFVRECVASVNHMFKFFFLESNCFFHQYHLATRALLVEADNLLKVLEAPVKNVLFVCCDMVQCMAGKGITALQRMAGAIPTELPFGSGLQEVPSMYLG